jgi:plastocyanin
VRTTLVVTAVLLAGSLSGCGDGESNEATETFDANPASDGVAVTAPEDGELAFSEETLETTPGSVTVTFKNPADIAHDFCLETTEGEDLGCTGLVALGDDAVREFQLAEGEYTYYCPVAGHREEGMDGTLIAAS